jgi:2-polyprenyl-3-methyl-5-hydroxy-6-metoxy-1,4-benzoquinol methylase
VRESAAPRDIDYLLRDVSASPVRFRLTHRSSTHTNGLDGLVSGFVRDHAGVTVSDLRANVPALAEQAYDEVRAVVIRLVEAGVLEPDGMAPLEEVDTRYERVAACDLCGSPSEGHKTLFWKYNTPVVRCSGCGLLYANPRWTEEQMFGRYTEEYWAHYADAVRPTASDAAANQQRWDPFVNAIEPARQDGRPSKLLDVGCATGEFLSAAKTRGWDTYGVETSPMAAEQAERFTDSQVHVGTLEAAPFEDGFFDAVTLWDVIEHLHSPSAYINRIARLLRPGGMLALTTPNIRSLSFRLLGRHWWVVGPNDHIYYFAPRTIERLLSERGFKIHHMSCMDVLLDSWQRWLRYPTLQRLAPAVQAVARPMVLRYLLGDELVVVARRC